MSVLDMADCIVGDRKVASNCKTFVSIEPFTATVVEVRSTLSCTHSPVILVQFVVLIYVLSVEVVVVIPQVIVLSLLGVVSIKMVFIVAFCKVGCDIYTNYIACCDDSSQTGFFPILDFLAFCWTSLSSVSINIRVIISFRLRLMIALSRYCLNKMFCWELGQIKYNFTHKRNLFTVASVSHCVWSIKLRSKTCSGY